MSTYHRILWIIVKILQKYTISKSDSNQRVSLVVIIIKLLKILWTMWIGTMKNSKMLV